jgi:hypothetical protein
MCGKSVLASNISAFREHRDQNVFLYDSDSFCEQYQLADSAGDTSGYRVKYHIILEDEIGRWLVQN